MNGGDLTVNPWNGFEYELDGVRIQIPPSYCWQEHPTFYRAVEAAVNIMHQKTKALVKWRKDRGE